MPCRDESCTLPAFANTQETENLSEQREILYIGDPMCSWCWGLSPALTALHQLAQAHNVGFSVIVGGLRAGGSDAWTDDFRRFLRQHWQEIGERSGQPFSLNLLDWPHFDYDTEPACRAVVVARQMLHAQARADEVYSFFCAVQQRFYVNNQDPKEIDLYKEICIEHGLDFHEFAQRFSSPAARTETLADFTHCRRLGVHAFPTVLFQDNAQRHVLAAGYVRKEHLLEAFKDQVNRFTS